MTDTVTKKPRKSRLPADPRAAVEKRVSKTKNAIRGLAKKFPKEVLTEEAVAKIAGFLRLQVDSLERELLTAVRTGSVTVDGFSLDAPPVTPAKVTSPYRVPESPTNAVPRALVATAEDAPDLVRVVSAGAKRATPDVTEIDFVEE